MDDNSCTPCCDYCSFYKDHGDTSFQGVGICSVDNTATRASDYCNEYFKCICGRCKE